MSQTTKTPTEKIMDTIKHHIWTVAQYELNWNKLNFSKVGVSKGSEHRYDAWILDLPKGATTAVLEKTKEKLEKKANGEYSVYKHKNRRLYVAPTSTEEEVINFAELKTVLQGEEVLKAQKALLLEKEKWLEELKVLRDLKKPIKEVA